MKQNEGKPDLEIAELNNQIISKIIKFLLSDFENKYIYKLEKDSVYIYKDSDYENLIFRIGINDYNSFAAVIFENNRLRKSFIIKEDSQYKDLIDEILDKIDLLISQEILEVLNDFK